MLLLSHGPFFYDLLFVVGVLFLVGIVAFVFSLPREESNDDSRYFDNEKDK